MPESPTVLPLPTPPAEDVWSVDKHSLEAFAKRLQAPPTDRAWHELRREAERIALVPGFERLITLDANAIKALPHQIDVAQRVLRHMSGRAILADEVGLGKTIEASIIYKELAIRGLARRVLILTPASLVGQWQGELEQKFFERFDTPSEPDDWLSVTKAIVSHDRARSRRHAEEILRHRWDLVIVDEAHKVKSQRGATYQFIEKIERDFILLLTATPLQNDLRELYNLVTLLRPGQLGTWPEFRKVHLVAGDRRMPKDPAALRALTHEVMIRTRRTSVIDDLNLPPRRARHPEVRLTKAEADLYQGTTEFLRRLYREGFVQPAAQEEGDDGTGTRKRTRRGIIQLAVIHLRQRLCSSARALAESLEHLAQGERINPAYRTIAKQLAKRAKGIKTHAKLTVLTDLLKETPDRVVVFSDHRPTIELIEERVTKLGRKAIVYWGAHSTPERDKRIRAVGEEQEQLNSVIAPDDNAVRLERRFQELSAAGRLRLGYGTSHLVRAAGWDAKRQRLGVHVTEVLEALKSIERIGGVTTHQPAGSHPKYGELVRLSGVSSSGRAIALVAQVDRLPLFLAHIEADAE